jgi:hypothetical protein
VKSTEATCEVGGLWKLVGRDGHCVPGLASVVRVFAIVIVVHPSEHSAMHAHLNAIERLDAVHVLCILSPKHMFFFWPKAF